MCGGQQRGSSERWGSGWVRSEPTGWRVWSRIHTCSRSGRRARATTCCTRSRCARSPPTRARPTRRGGLFVAGIALFSGSLYLMTLTGIRWLGAITPLGGLCLIAGWLVLAFAPRRA